MSKPSCYKDKGIKKSEFVAKPQDKSIRIKGIQHKSFQR